MTGEVIPVVRYGKDDVFDFKIETTDIKEVSEEQIDLLQHGNSNNGDQYRRHAIC